MSGVEQSTLRYWDSIGLFRPARRDEGNKYRYYTLDQIFLVNFIQVLSSLNIPLKVIAKLNENRTPEAVLELMEQQENILDIRLSQLQEAYSTIHTLRDTIRQGIAAPEPGAVALQSLEEMSIALGPYNEEDASFHESFVRYCRHAQENFVNLNYPIGGYYESFTRFPRASRAPDRFFSMVPRAYEKRPAGKYLVSYARGHYGEMGELPQCIETYAREHNVKLGGPVYVLYLLDEISVQEPADYLAQVCVALS